MEPEPFSQIMKKGKVNIKWGRFNIRKYLKPLQCYNCYKYGHLAKYCRLKKKCRNCGSEEHETGNCTQDTHCINCQQHNLRFNTSFDNHHSVRDRT